MRLGNGATSLSLIMEFGKSEEVGNPLPKFCFGDGVGEKETRE